VIRFVISSDWSGRTEHEVRCLVTPTASVQIPMRRMKLRQGERHQENEGVRVRVLLDRVSYDDICVQSKPFILEEISMYWVNVCSKNFVVEE